LKIEQLKEIKKIKDAARVKNKGKTVAKMTAGERNELLETIARMLRLID